MRCSSHHRAAAALLVQCALFVQLLVPATDGQLVAQYDFTDTTPGATVARDSSRGGLDGVYTGGRAFSGLSFSTALGPALSPRPGHPNVVVSPAPAASTTARTYAMWYCDIAAPTLGPAYGLLAQDGVVDVHLLGVDTGPFTLHSVGVTVTDASGVPRGTTFGTTIPTNRPAHFAVTVDMQARALHVYHNGIRRSSASLFNSTIALASTPLVIGSRADGSQPFPSALDRVEVFDGALTEREVRVLVAAAGIIHGNCPTRVASPTMTATASVTPTTTTPTTTTTTTPITATIAATTPPPSKVKACQGTAHYRITFRGLWTARRTAQGFPPGAYWAEPVGFAHTRALRMDRQAQVAQPGIRELAEQGLPIPLVRYLAFEREASSIALGARISSTNQTSFDLALTPRFPYATILSRMGLSPDWMAAGRFSLCNPRTDAWKPRVRKFLRLVDVGTNDAVGFGVPAITPASPHPLYRIKSTTGSCAHPFYNPAQPMPHLARATFELVRVDPQ